MDEVYGKRILVLGCGYLGRIVVREALGRGMKTLAVSRNQDSLQEVERLGSEVCCAQVDGEEWHLAAGQEVDFVLNCVSSAGGGLAGYRKSYIEGNASLCRWAEKVGFSGTSVYTSSVSAYGDAAGEWVDEATGPAPENERGQLVRESEELFLAGMSGRSKAVLRLAGLYGPGRHLLLNRLREAPAELPGWGDYYLNLVRIEDVASAVWKCFESTRALKGVWGVVDDEPSLKMDMIGWLSDRLGVAVPRFSGSNSGAGSRRLGESGRPANRRISNKAIKQDLGWRPEFPDFRAGFADLIAKG